MCVEGAIHAHIYNPPKQFLVNVYDHHHRHIAQSVLNNCSKFFLEFDIV